MKLYRAMPRAVMIALASSAALLPALFADAADNAPQQGNAKFQRLDKNKDGFLTRDEVRAIRGDYDKAFDEADDNKDGKLDPGEFLKAEAIHERLVTGTYVDDSVITAKVKAALLKEPQLKSMDVSVETYRGEVLLSGFVRNETQRDKAKKVATKISGVSSVKDAMIVRN
jgi:hyperosmotically inducible periplasmic protein